jgi:hypothetical protein
MKCITRPEFLPACNDQGYTHWLMLAGKDTAVLSGFSISFDPPGTSISWKECFLLRRYKLKQNQDIDHRIFDFFRARIVIAGRNRKKHSFHSR